MKRSAPVTLLVALLLSACGCHSDPRAGDGKGLKRFEYSRQTFGQPLRLVLYADDRPGADRARDAAFAKLTEIEGRLDARIPASEVARFSESAGGPWIPVSQELFSVLQRAAQLTEQTGGAFDVTAGPATALWDGAVVSGTPPTEAEIASTKALIGMRMLQVKSIDRSARLLLPGMIVDLDPLDIGYAIDAALITLRNIGVRRALMEMRPAGIAAAIGTPPGEPGWKMTVPIPNEKGKPTAVLLSNDGAAWSPVTKRPSKIGPFEYSGLIYTETAMPKSARARVLVLAPGATLAGGIRQGITVLGSAAGPFIRMNGRARVTFARSD